MQNTNGVGLAVLVPVVGENENAEVSSQGKELACLLNDGVVSVSVGCLVLADVIG